MQQKCQKLKFVIQPTFGMQAKFGMQPMIGMQPKFGIQPMIGMQSKFGMQPKFAIQPYFNRTRRCMQRQSSSAKLGLTFLKLDKIG